MDPIHGFINISEYDIIEKLIESKYFQRLRRLCQLGMTSAVYPSATHTRFSHCLGVMHVFLVLFDSLSRRSVTEIKDKNHKRKVGAIAALLHDIGHGPFSHASESILSDGKFDHLEMTCKIISETEISDNLRQNAIEPSLVCDILTHEVSEEWLLISQLVSSQLDADRLDYLLRDSYFTGVNYGKVDIHRIANTLDIWTKNDLFSGTAVINAKGISAIEDYILGRYLMYRKVYFHKISRCMELLLTKVFKRASELENPALIDLIDIKNETSPELLYKIDDGVCLSLFHKWTNSEDHILKDLSLRILERGRLASKQMSLSKYVRLGIEKLSQLPRIVEESNFSKEYYFMEDAVEKSAYDIYMPQQIDDDGFSPITHIMTPNEENKLEEISKHSKVITALTDKDLKITSIFFPEQTTKKIEEIIGKDK